MKNENENHNKRAEETQEEILDALIERMGKSGATIEGLKNIVAAIEKRKAMLDEANHEDKRIEIVRRTISPEVEEGIVIAAYMNKNGSLEDSVFFAKGNNLVALSMMTTALLDMLAECGVSLDKYIHSLQLMSEKGIQLISDERKKK